MIVLVKDTSQQSQKMLISCLEDVKSMKKYRLDWLNKMKYVICQCQTMTISMPCDSQILIKSRLRTRFTLAILEMSQISDLMNLASGNAPFLRVRRSSNSMRTSMRISMRTTKRMKMRKKQIISTQSWSLKVSTCVISERLSSLIILMINSNYTSSKLKIWSINPSESNMNLKQVKHR